MTFSQPIWMHEVYMKQPDGYVQGSNNLVCKLIQRLENTHGIRSVALKWFISYLTDPTQRVVIGENSSSLMALESGQWCSPGLCTGYTAVPPVYCWYSRYNPSARIRGPLLCRGHSNVHSLFVGGCAEIYISDSYRVSTVSIDGWPLTDWSSTETKQNLYGLVRRGDFFKCNQIRCLSRELQLTHQTLRIIWRSLSKETTRLVLHAFVVSRLDYCNALFTGLPCPNTNPSGISTDLKCSRTSLRGSCQNRWTKLLNWRMVTSVTTWEYSSEDQRMEYFCYINKATLKRN